MRLLSVNTGKLQRIPGDKSRTRSGICKLPILGRVSVLPHGLEGDEIGNKQYHGGPDQAVYLYSGEDYAWWQRELGRELPFGIFGENFTLESFGERSPRVGDIWRWGEVELQLTGPRIPCSKLAARMGDPKFVKIFARANRGGAYARVLRPGVVETGMVGTLQAANGSPPTIDALFELCHRSPKDPELMRHALDFPLAERLRAMLEMWLHKA